MFTAAARPLSPRLAERGGASPKVREWMRLRVNALAQAISAQTLVHGVARCFGPFAEYTADDRDHQGLLDLILHLSAGQGPGLDIETMRLMLSFRLHEVALGRSGALDRWGELSTLLCAGFVPVVTALGGVSASGDLVPLAYAMAGNGGEWDALADLGWKVSMAEQFSQLGLDLNQCQPRGAVPFAHYMRASLTASIRNQRRLRPQVWSAVAFIDIMVDLLEVSGEPYDHVVMGPHRYATAAWWIRVQAVGEVIDFADAIEVMLDCAAQGCSDKPVLGDEGIFHTDNFYFYAITTVLLDEIRQSSCLATIASFQTNLDNQDVVGPMELMGPLRVAKQPEHFLLILMLGSLALVYLSRTLGKRPTAAPSWLENAAASERNAAHHEQ